MSAPSQVLLLADSRELILQQRDEIEAQVRQGRLTLICLGWWKPDPSHVWVVMPYMMDGL